MPYGRITIAVERVPGKFLGNKPGYRFVANSGGRRLYRGDANHPTAAEARKEGAEWRAHLRANERTDPKHPKHGKR